MVYFKAVFDFFEGRIPQGKTNRLGTSISRRRGCEQSSTLKHRGRSSRWERKRPREITLLRPLDPIARGVRGGYPGKRLFLFLGIRSEGSPIRERIAVEGLATNRGGIGGVHFAGEIDDVWVRVHNNGNRMALLCARRRWQIESVWPHNRRAFVLSGRARQVLKMTRYLQLLQFQAANQFLNGHFALQYAVSHSAFDQFAQLGAKFRCIHVSISVPVFLGSGACFDSYSPHQSSYKVSGHFVFRSVETKNSVAIPPPSVSGTTSGEKRRHWPFSFEPLNAVQYLQVWQVITFRKQ
ncbi:MAG TPA: hypothetical protein VN761_05650 [Candidatus Polarisedimenticolia bacterium]|nr:hypothetical protein [Candidatus Polarisedimenticolia bacterium]